MTARQLTSDQRSLSSVSAEQLTTAEALIRGRTPHHVDHDDVVAESKLRAGAFANERRRGGRDSAIGSTRRTRAVSSLSERRLRVPVRQRPCGRGTRRDRGGRRRVLGLDPGSQHDVQQCWGDATSAVCEGTCTYTRHDGSTVTLPFVDVLHFRGGKANGIASTWT